MTALPLKQITSRENPEIKNLRKLLSSKKERDGQGLFVCEGIRLCLDGIRSGHTPAAIYMTEETAAKHPELAEAAGQAGCAAVIPRFLAESVADTKSTQGVFAVFKKLDNLKCPVTIRNGKCFRYVLLSTVQDPGNLGAILRTCEAFGVDGVILSPDCADPYGPKALRAAMGAIFRLPVAPGADLAAEIRSLRGQGAAVYAAALRKDAVSVKDCDFSGASAILIGNEGNGLPEALIAACTGSVMVPMAGGAESLNAGAAAHILIWEMTGSKPGTNAGRQAGE